MSYSTLCGLSSSLRRSILRVINSNVCCVHHSLRRKSHWGGDRLNIKEKQLKHPHSGGHVHVANSGERARCKEHLRQNLEFRNPHRVWMRSYHQQQPWMAAKVPSLSVGQGICQRHGLRGRGRAAQRGGVTMAGGSPVMGKQNHGSTAKWPRRKLSHRGPRLHSAVQMAGFDGTAKTKADATGGQRPRRQADGHSRRQAAL